MCVKKLRNVVNTWQDEIMNSIIKVYKKIQAPVAKVLILKLPELSRYSPLFFALPFSRYEWS